MRYTKAFLVFSFIIGIAYSHFPKPYIVIPKSSNDINRIYSLGGEIQNSSTNHIKFYADDNCLIKLIEYGFDPIELVDTNKIIVEFERNRFDVICEEEIWSSYHSFDGLSLHLHELEEEHSDIVDLFSIGESVDGRNLWCLKISDNVTEHENEPAVLYISSIHGDEPIGMEFIVALAESLTEKYIYDTRLTNIVNNTELYLIPLMNPDGWEYVPYPIRRNKNTIDLNRNYPVPSGEIGDDDTYFIEIENQSLMEFIQSLNLTFTIDFHTGATVVNYPWDYDSFEVLPDSQLISERAIDYSIRNSPMYTSPEFENGVVFGAWWYQVQGSLEDWNYYSNGFLHFIVELYNVKMPYSSILSSIWQDNYESYLYLIERSQEGIHITVKDTFTLEPLKANIIVDDLPWIYQSDSLVGDFHRELLEGYYDFEISKDGYDTKYLTSIFVPNEGSTELEVFLKDTEFNIHESNTQDRNVIQIYPNPFNTLCQFSSDLISKVSIYDLEGKLVFESSTLNKHVWKPSMNAKSGVYFAKIKIGNQLISRQIYFLK